MTAEPISTEAAAGWSTWQHLDEMVEELSSLTRSGLAPRDFWSRLLDRTLHALGAVGGTAWTCPDSESFVPAARGGSECDAWNGGDQSRRRHDRLLAHVARTRLALALPPSESAASAQGIDNPTPHLLLLSPVICDERTVAILEIFVRPSELPTAAEGYLRLLAAVCELAADYERGRELDELRLTAGTHGQFERFTRSIHSSLDVEQVAYRIANEARALCCCDRVSVAIMHGRRARVKCVSGADVIDRRGTAIRRLEALLTAVTKIDEPLYYPTAEASLPPQLEEALHAQLDQSHARILTIIPLHRSEAETHNGKRPTIIGALALESFTSTDSLAANQSALRAIAAQAQVALQNALDFEAIPLARLWRAVGRSGGNPLSGQLIKSLAAVATMAACVAALVFLPVDFTVEGRGELLPVERREIFAPVDGVVADVRVAHGDLVEAGQTLLVLRKPQLDFERARITGEMLTARKRLTALQTARFGGAAAAADARDQNHQRTAEEEEVKELIASLTAQRDLLDQQEAELTVRSPIAGQVLTWDVSQLLAARPVVRGQALLTIGDSAGPWELELRVPDDRIGHVLAARRNAENPLGVSYLLALDPDHSYQARLHDVALTTEIGESGVPEVAVTADVDRAELPRLRPGASVVAKIDCGRRPLGFVWLHELWDTIRTRVLF